MDKLTKLLNSFERQTEEETGTDEDFWMYYGDIDPAQAAAELEALNAELNFFRCQFPTAAKNYQAVALSRQKEG